MISEFNSSRHRVFRVNPQLYGALDVSVDASVKASTGRAEADPPAVSKDGSLVDNAAACYSDDSTVAALSRYARRLYTPYMSEAGVTQRMFNYTLWYSMQTMYAGAASALTVRTLLVAGRTPRVLASFLSPFLILLVQQCLHRAFPRTLTRTHRRLRDPPLKSSIFYTGVASSLLSVLGVMLASRRFGRTGRGLVVGLLAALGLSTVLTVASTQSARYVAREYGLSFPSLPSRALLLGSARAYREGFNVLAGIAGLVSCLAVSLDSVVTRTALFSAASAFATLQAARCVVDRRLTVERLEKCLHGFALSMDAHGGLQNLNDTALSVSRLTSEESLFTMPLPWIHQRVPITFGDSFYTTLRAASSLNTRQKMNAVQAVEGCLATRGVALVYNGNRNTYHVLFAGRLYPGPISDKSMLGVPSGGPVEPATRFGATTLAMKELWAYFYAFVHYQGGSKVVVTADSDMFPTDFHIISALTADGTFDASTQPMEPFDFSLTRSDAQQLVADGRLDPLYPQFLSFVEGLVNGGWCVDHVRLPNEGWGIAVHYL